MRLTRKAVWAGIWLSAVGCSSQLPERDNAVGPLEQISATITLVGDTQEHEIMGLPPSLKGGLVDSELEVTIRQPQHALFGRTVLAEIIKRYAGDMIVHLGDVIDVSCRSELQRIDQVFALAGDRWAVAPGNHDGLAMGVFNFSSDAWKLAYGGRAWDYECRVPKNGKVDESGAMQGYFASADTFLHWYLDRIHVLADDGQAVQVPGPPVPTDGPDAVRCKAPPGQLIHWDSHRESTDTQTAPAFLKELSGRLEHWSPCGGTTASRSYILQKLELPRHANAAGLKVSLVLLDTTQTGRRFDGFGLGLFADSVFGDTFSNSPGQIGYMMDDQIAELRRMVEAQSPDEILLFAGHHNWDSLSAETRKKLAGVFASVQNPLVYISAHTHTGFWRDHTAGPRSLLELNVSSLADWPVAFRRMTVYATLDRKRIEIDAPVNGMANSTETTEGEPSKAKQLVSDWRQYCEQHGVDFDELRLQHSTIVDKHRRARQNLAMFIDALLTDNVRSQTVDDWDNYLDKLNDLEFGAEAVGATGDLNPRFKEKLVSAMPEMTTCKADKKETLRTCFVRKWREIRIEKEKNSVVQSYYARIASFISDVQQIVTATLPDDELRPYMACTAVVSAMSDQSIQDSRRPDDLLSDGSFYDRRRTAN